MATALGGCGGGSSSPRSPPPPQTYTISGTVTGLAGSGLTLTDNGGDSLAVSGGSFTFATSIASGGSYRVSIAAQPVNPTQSCTVINASGTATANVTDAQVSCLTPPPPRYAISGTVTGLAGAGLVLQKVSGANNALESLAINTVAGSIPFAFATDLASADAYTVTVLTQPTSPAQTCTVSNGTGTARAAVTNVMVACVTTNYSVGGTILGLVGSGLTLKNNGADPLVMNGTISGSTRKFTFVTPISIGGAYGVTVATAPTGPTQVCNVTDGVGSVAAIVTNVVVDCRVTRFVYAANASSNTISNFIFDPTTGQLRSHGFELVSGSQPSAVAVEATGQYAYAASFGSVANGILGKVSAFTIATDGSLVPLSGASAVTDLPPSSNPVAIAVDPSGHNAYVLTQGANSIMQYSIGVDGALTAGSVTSVGASPTSLTLDPSGRFLYVANSGDNTVAQFSINAGNGVLGIIGSGTVSSGTKPARIAVDPSGRYAYVACSGGGVSQYTIGADGALTSMATHGVAAGTNTLSVAIDPSAQHAYVASAKDNSLFVFLIDAAGALTLQATLAVPSGSLPSVVVVDPSGQYAFVANTGLNSVGDYSIASDGTLSPLKLMPTVATQNNPVALALARGVGP